MGQMGIARTLVVLGSAVFFSACGGSAWEGSFAGTLKRDVVCPDHADANLTRDVTVTLDEAEADLLRAEITDSPCSPVMMEMEGDGTATFRNRTCLEYESAPYTIRPSVTGGRLQLAGDTLSGAMQSTEDRFEGTTGRGNCSVTETITAYRVR